MTRIVVNALIFKRNGGGGTQITKNFILETLKHREVEWFYFVSNDADEVFGNMFTSEKGSHYFVFPNQPDIHTKRDVQKKINYVVGDIRPDVVYTILAPSYMSFDCKEVQRCCNAWDYNKHIPKYVLKTLSFKQRFHMFVSSTVKRRLMKKAQFFVTQTKVAANGIDSIVHCGLDKIKVVPNVIPAVYLGYEVKKVHGENLNLVFVTDPVPHKNLEIIPQVARLLKKQYKLDNFKFHVTIPFSNMRYVKYFNGLLKFYNVEDYVENVGYQTQEQLKKLYSKCDIYFFPSLFETFSVALLEAMYFKMPIVSTDINFNREVAQDAALYFEPKNAEQAAKQVARIATDKILYQELINAGQERLAHYGDYNKHFCDTMDFLIECSKHKD